MIGRRGLLRGLAAALLAPGRLGAGDHQEDEMGWSNVAAAVLQAVTVIITAGTPNSGIFLYAGTPADGNLIGSWTSQAGTDAENNAYPAGFQVVGYPGGGSVSISPYTAAAGESPVLQLATAMGIASRFGQIRETTTFGNTAEVLAITGPALTSDAASTYIEMLLFSAGDGGSATALATFGLNESNSFFPVLNITNAGGYMIGTVDAQSPFNGQPEADTWSTAVPNTGWGFTGVTAPDMSYKITATRSCRIEGNIKYLSGTPSSGAVMFTLPTQYAPPTLKYCVSPTANGWFLIEVATNGNVSIQNWGGYVLGATPSVYISFEFPTDI